MNKRPNNSTRSPALPIACAIALLSAAAISLASSFGSTPTPTPSPIGCQILYDQTNGTTGAGTSSQDFETANDAFDDQAADDFVVPSGQTWTIMQIFAVGSYFNGTGSMPGVNIFFYNNSGTLPGSLIASFLNVAPVIDTAGTITVTIPGAGQILTAGTYWMSVQARMDFAAGGQWSWGSRAPQVHSPAAWQNPGLGFASGCATWAPRGATCGIDAPAPDQAFQLRGCVSGGPPLTPTPTPIPGPTPTPGPTPIWITLASRLSDALADASSQSGSDHPPAQTQTDFSPAHLTNSATAGGESGHAIAGSTSNSSITVDNSMGTVQISGDGSASSRAMFEFSQGTASAKLIVLNFTIATPSYGYSLTGQLSTYVPSSGFCSCSGVATARLTAGSTTLFEVTADNTSPPSVTLAQTGTLSPGNYTFSMELDTGVTGNSAPTEYNALSSANFNLALTPAATPTPGPTATATPSPSPVGISGAVSYCSNPVPGPVPNVTLTQTGDTSGSTLSDGSGSYQFSSIASGGSYTVTPTKADRAPGSAGINTLDVIAVQRHFLGSSLLTGCRLTAANVTPPATINTLDVIAIQHFFLGQTIGIGNTGKYQFNPVSRTYAPLTSDQTGQNYDAIILGDVAGPFVSPP